MGTQPEARLQRRIRKRLVQEVGGWWRKIWGGPFTEAGTPDILGCCGGLFFAFEVKTLSGKASEIQLDTIEEIRDRGQGVAKIITSPEEAVETVKKALRRAGRSSTGRGRVGRSKNGRRMVLRTRDRKDLDDRRHHRA